MHALVTGGTRGIGYEFVKKLVQLQIPTVFTGRNEKDIQVIEHSFSPYQHVEGIPLDLSSRSSVDRFLKELHYRDIHPNIIIHNAGYLSTKPVETHDHLERLFHVNAISPIYITQQLLPVMKQYKVGHVLFFSPPYSIDRKVNLLMPYMQSKLAQTSYMKSLAHTLKSSPISVNSIWTKFPLWTDAIRVRKMGDVSQCVHPSIMSRVLQEVLQEDPVSFKGNELVDATYLCEKNIPLNEFYLSGQSPVFLEDLFMTKLSS